MLDSNAKIFIAGHKGMVGSALVRKFQSAGFRNILVADRTQLDLRDSVAVEAFFSKNRPDYVVLAAAKVGGIQANIDAPADFLLDNLTIQNNVIMAASKSQVRKFCFLGSSCIYPKESPQPMKEEYLLSGPLEPTNEGYSLAKIAGLRLVQYLAKQRGFPGICPMPCNLYGRNDSFDPMHSHVLSATIRRFSDAVDSKLEHVTMWGSGTARREFMNVTDLADAVYFLMENYDSPEIINVGCGEDVSIFELATMISEQVGFRGEIRWDTSKPDGMARKCLDVSKIRALGFQPKVDLKSGVQQMVREYQDYKKGVGRA